MSRFPPTTQEIAQAIFEANKHRIDFESVSVTRDPDREVELEIKIVRSSDETSGE